jgi:hypothetical protein
MQHGYFGKAVWFATVPLSIVDCFGKTTIIYSVVEWYCKALWYGSAVHYRKVYITCMSKGMGTQAQSGREIWYHWKYSTVSLYSNLFIMWLSKLWCSAVP